MVFTIISENSIHTLVYKKNNHTYRGEICTPEKYFLYEGYVEYIKDNLINLKFVNNYAVYRLIKIPMKEIIEEMTMADMQKKIRQLEDIICCYVERGDNGLVTEHIQSRYDCKITYDKTETIYELVEDSDESSDSDKPEHVESNDN